MHNFFLVILLCGSCLLLSACNDERGSNTEQAQPDLKPNCKIHCAP